MKEWWAKFNGLFVYLGRESAHVMVKYGSKSGWNERNVAVCRADRAESVQAA